MKKLPLICLVFLTAWNASRAQDAIIVKRDGSNLTVHIGARSATHVFIPNGSIKLSEISSITLQERVPADDRWYKTLESAGIELHFDRFDMPASQPITQEQLKQKILQQQPDEDLDARIQKFQVQSTTGKALQLVGIVAVGISGAMLAQSKPDLGAIQGLAIGGSALSAIGFIVDMNALQHLRKR